MKIRKQRNEGTKEQKSSFSVSLFFSSSVRTQQAGFVVLFTVLISSIILAIAIGVSMVALGEVLLSASAKEGNISFFAADTGAECALYWDRIEDAFNPTAPIIPNCDGNPPFDTISNFEFYFSLNEDKNCARISVNKDYSPPECPDCTTQIRSRGYNVACDNIEKNPRAIERAIEVTY